MQKRHDLIVFVAAVRAAQSLDDIARLQREHRDMLMELMQGDPVRYSDVADEVGAAKRRLSR